MKINCLHSSVVVLRYRTARIELYAKVNNRVNQSVIDNVNILTTRNCYYNILIQNEYYR